MGRQARRSPTVRATAHRPTEASTEARLSVAPTNSLARRTRRVPPTRRGRRTLRRPLRRRSGKQHVSLDSLKIDEDSSKDTFGVRSWNFFITHGYNANSGNNIFVQT